MTPTGPAGARRILAVADSDSYLKWGASLLSTAPASWQKSLVILATPAEPSTAQVAAALAQVPELAGPPVLDLVALMELVTRLQPDAVLLSLRGRVIKVVVRALATTMPNRPVIVSGLPGISIPATRPAVDYRAQADLFVLHSKREIREFTALAALMDVPQEFGLATFPFLTADGPHSRSGGDVVFAAQAKVPAALENRMLLLGWLAASARLHPLRRVVIKVRGTAGEAQTHAETHGYAELLADLEPAPPGNLVVEGGAMADHLAGAAALVTISSTAAIEAVALGVPVLVLDDFGVSSQLINTVFIGSDLFGDRIELIEGRFRQPSPDWLEDNYFHDPSRNTWIARLELLLADRDSGILPLKDQSRGTFGGPVRRAWDRKLALGEHDHTLSGRLALLVGTPLRWVVLGKNRARRLRRRAAREGLASKSVGALVRGSEER